MACMLRGLWIFHAEADVRLLTSRRFPTVERKMQKLLGDDYVALPCDEDINIMFIDEVLHEEEDHHIPPGVPEPFHEDFRQGSFAWNTQKEAYVEKLWPLGPIASICQGKIWPLLFLFKKGFYLVTVVALEKKYTPETVRALELPQITAAFAVLEDICDFIPSNLTIADVAGIAELQYYIRSAIPFGSPVNTNYHLLRTVRQGFPNREEETTQRSPAWKPYLYKGKSKLSLSIVETVNCTLYGKPEYEDECYIAGHVYCCVDLPGIPEISIPISFQNGSGPPPEISVHNCAHIPGGIRAAKEESFKISCTPPTGPFVLCRYRRSAEHIVPVRGFYQIKEMSPVEFRLLLQIQFHPSIGNTFWSCQVRLPFHHRGVIKSSDLKCTGGSFSLTDQGQSILWNLNVRRPRGSLETNLLGELIFESPKSSEGQEGGPISTKIISSPAAGAHTGHGPSHLTHGNTSHASSYSSSLGGDRSGSAVRTVGAPQLGVGGTLMVNKGGDAFIVGSALTPSGGLMYATPASGAGPKSSTSHSDTSGAGAMEHRQQEAGQKQAQERAAQLAQQRPLLSDVLPAATSTSAAPFGGEASAVLAAAAGPAAAAAVTSGEAGNNSSTSNNNGNGSANNNDSSNNDSNNNSINDSSNNTSQLLQPSGSDILSMSPEGKGSTQTLASGGPQLAAQPESSLLEQQQQQQQQQEAQLQLQQQQQEQQLPQTNPTNQNESGDAPNTAFTTPASLSAASSSSSTIVSSQLPAGTATTTPSTTAAAAAAAAAQTGINTASSSNAQQLGAGGSSSSSSNVLQAAAAAAGLQLPQATPAADESQRVTGGSTSTQGPGAQANSSSVPGGASNASGNTTHPTFGLIRDPFLHGVNCYAEVFLEVPDTTLSGIKIDPKAVTVYPASRISGAVGVQKEVLTGKYVIWNMAGEVRGHHSDISFDQCLPVGSEEHGP